MTSLKIKFRPLSIDGHEGTIYYQIIHNRKCRLISTTYHLRTDEWDSKRASISIAPNSPRQSLLISTGERIRKDVKYITRIINRLETADINYSADVIADEFVRYNNQSSLYHYMDGIIARLRLNGKVRTAETYLSALRSIKHFRKGEDLMIDCMTASEMEAYEAWLRERGVVPNTISFYMRILRAVYNRAVEDDITNDRKPFRHVYTGIDKTVKRALPLTAIKCIRSLNLTGMPKLDYARDMFMLSFYLRGMSFIDMAYLKKNDLKDGRITYYRRKTSQRLIIAWTKEMQQIIDKYSENASDYLLPIIRNRGINERCTYHNMGYMINHHLKQVAAMAGISVPLTLYVARHSWASAAHSKGIPVAIISEGMGHDSEATTRIYLASLDTSAVDRANSIILGALK